MKFHAGDLVEVITQSEAIDPRSPARPGMRGTVIAFVGYAPTAQLPSEIGEARSGGEWYECEFNGGRVHARESALRKVPPDPGRELVRWDQRFWRAPRSLVEA